MKLDITRVETGLIQGERGLECTFAESPKKQTTSEQNSTWWRKNQGHSITLEQQEPLGGSGMWLEFFLLLPPPLQLQGVMLVEQERK